MLASTMQHSTHNHIPATFDHHHPNHREALDDPDRELSKHPQGCLLRTQQCVDIHELALCVPPSATPQDVQGVTCSKIRRTTLSTSSRGQPHQHGGLLRKEVIQPHLPV